MRFSFREMAIKQVAAFHHEHPSYKWWVLGNILITTFMSVLESTVVNTALPKMQASFGTSLDTIAWVMTAYLLVFAVVLPLSGWLADKIGYKRTFFISLALFTSGSFMCAFAWNEGTLIAFRVWQGIGGGMIMPVGMAIVTREFPPQQRGLAMGFYGISAAASISVGPSLGGYLADNFGWGSVFLINVPIGIVGLIATLLIQREYKHPKAAPFDVWGFVSISVFLVSLLLALQDGNAAWNTGGWTSPFILTCFGIAAASLAIFLIVELNIEHPIVPLRLFAVPNFMWTNVLMFIFGLGIMGSTFLMPVYLQGTLGYTALQSGLIFLPLGIIQSIASPVSGILGDKTNPRVPAFIGIGALVLSFWMNTLLTGNPPGWLVQAPIWLRGLGFGLIFVTIQSVAMQSLPMDRIAQGSSLINLTRQIGSSFGVAILQSVLNGRNSFHTAVTGEGMNQWSEAFRSAAAGLRFAMQDDGGHSVSNANILTSSLISGQAVTNAFVQSVTDAFWIVTVLTAVCLVPILLIKVVKKKPGVKGEGKQHAPAAAMD